MGDYFDPGPLLRELWANAQVDRLYERERLARKHYTFSDDAKNVIWLLREAVRDLARLAHRR